MKHHYILIIGLIFSFSIYTSAENIQYAGSWGENGLSVTAQSNAKVVLNFSVPSIELTRVQINGEQMTELSMPDVFLPNDEGAPNLPGMGRYIAVPNGAVASVKMVEYRTESIQHVNLAPAPRIPWDTERGALEYHKNQQIYSSNTFYPAKPVKLSEITEIRGFDAVMLGITPFQYNPVTKELIVYKDIKLEIAFTGGNGQFGEDRLRSRWWDSLLQDIFVNEASIPEMDYNKSFQQTKDVGCEYLIVVPNDPEFQAWGDSIRNFRTLQGILSDVVTIDDIGANTTGALEGFFNDAYNNWDIVPSAVLLLGDYGTNGDNSIISPIWDNYCVSDNIYADVTGNSMPDIIFARITAQNEAQLEVMVSKFLNYERTPPTSEDFYNHPITALGWQTERWFQICSEAVSGFLRTKLGKDPVRINEVYQGNPDVDPWSSAPNTYQVINTFGPNGQGYIPATPTELGNWTGGGANEINDAINSGSFMLQHRDHGFEQGWGEPAYSSSNINSLTNTDLTFIFSVNCLTGKYNLASECFSEKFHRYTYNGQNAGALGLIAASEVSYSFVNDAYVWGMYDNMWPDFMPQYGSSVDYHGIMPAFGNAAGKYFLQQSAWPYNTSNKEVTYNLFHHLGDAFMTVYSEVPQDMNIVHNSKLLSNQTSFTVSADEYALICLTVNGEIIGTGESDGSPLQIDIPSQTAGNTMIVTVTKQNYYRYQSSVDIIDGNTAYVVQQSVLPDDASGNANGLMDYGESLLLDVTMENLGLVAANNVDVSLSTENSNITITDGSENFGNFTAGASNLVEGAFAFDVSYQIPDQEVVLFTLEASEGSTTWSSQFFLTAYAPVFDMPEFEIHDPTGNDNGRLDPGETAGLTITVLNSGSSAALNVNGTLSCEDPDITITTGVQNYGDLEPGISQDKSFVVEVSTSIAEGTEITFEFTIEGEGGISSVLEFSTVVGKFTALVLDLDPMNYSGPGILATFDNMDIAAEYETSFPDDLSQYKNLFICLGLHFTNYELSEEQGQQLKDFLEAGGNIYMEGRVTWKDDPQTPVHPMFNIEVVNYSMFLIEEVLGVPGPLTGNMNFGYEGNNPVNNYAIEPIAPAFSLFTTEADEKGCMVAYSEGTYHTIGSTIEFGELVDGNSPSTKAELMQKILNWFDGLTTGEEEHQSIAGQKNVMVSPNPFSNETTITLNTETESAFCISIYNMQGKRVRTLAIDEKVKGAKVITWDGRSDAGNVLVPGMYYIVSEFSNSTETAKVLLMK